MWRNARRKNSSFGWLVVLLALGTMSACTSTKLEYDRMTGTAFPPEQTVDGETVNLTTIYLDAGVLLDVDQDDTDISPLSGDYITEAELESLQAGYRSSPVSPETFSWSFCIFSGTFTRCYLYGMVVDHWYEMDDGTKLKTVLGIMWDGENRGAFASFYKNSTVQSDGSKYLRSTAHEIGHAFNLHHADGDGSTTIMNQTWVVGDTYTFEFSGTSLDHLNEHPFNCVCPGTGAFGSVSPSHPDHGWTTADCDDTG